MDFSLLIMVICGILILLLLFIYLRYVRAEAHFTFDIGGGSPRAAGGADTSKHKIFSGRLHGLGLAVAAVIGALTAKVWSIQLLSSEEYIKQAENNQTRTVYTSAPRGRILDRNGKEIVTNRPSLTVVGMPATLDNPIEMQLLANLIGMPYQAVRRKLQDTAEGPQSPRTISVDVSRRVIAYIGAHPALFPDVSIQERTERSYPQGTLAAHVVGYTGPITEDQLKASKDNDALNYHSGDVVGQTGIERQYESVLQGVRGEQTVYVDAAGNILDYSTRVDPQPGSDVILSLDLDIQQATEQAILDFIEFSHSRLGKRASAASAVVMDCTNGEILAMASYPTFSPSVFVGGISTADWDMLQSADANYPLLNRAIAGQYPSGSIAKPFTTLAALRAGVASAASSWYCSGVWKGFGDGYPMRCWLKSGHGSVNLVTGLTHSCDIPFYEIGKALYFSKDQQEAIQDRMKAYGLGQKQGIDIDGEVEGRVPDRQWKWNYWSNSPDDQRSWQGGDSANIAIGQGDLLVTALQMSCAYANIANRGTCYKPHLMKGVRARTGDGTVVDYEPSVLRTTDDEDGARDLVNQGMRGVIYVENARHWNSLKVDVRGKTGTAEHNHEDPVGWFCCYAPADSPKYVVVANVDEVLSGAFSGMLIARDILGHIYGQPDTSRNDKSGSLAR